MKSVSLALAALTLGLAASCKSTPGGSPANVYEYQEGSFEFSASIGNRQLERRLSIENPRAQRRSGRLYVQADLHNTGDTPLAMEYAVDWFDSSGFQVEMLDHWHPLAIGPNVVETVSLAAPVPSVSRWRLQVRPSQPLH